mgnify:FL=1
MHKHKYLSILIALLFLGCSEDPSVKERLLGTWVSDAELSSESVMDSKIMNHQQKEYLKKTFGVYQYVFTKLSATYSMVNGDPKDNVYFGWKVLKDGDDKVVIEISGSFSRTEKVEFIRKKNCIGIYNYKYDYAEYFCRDKG